jgi:dipeptidyl aminopeptidase/acylaminoacyl peptidase
MRDLRLDPENAEDIALAFLWLVEQPCVDEHRSGLLGTCVGGSFALMAAAKAAVRDRVAFVAAWAPYSSMRTLARDIASASVQTRAGRVPWQVDQLTRAVYVRSLTDVLDTDEAERLRIACVERESQIDVAPLSRDGQAIYPLLTTLDTRSAVAAIARLPASLQDRLDALSPIRYFNDIHAPQIVLAHDRDDAVIPIGESRRLRLALSGRSGVHYTEFTMFKHLDPTKVRLPLASLAWELGKFYRSVYPMFRSAVAA